MPGGIESAGRGSDRLTDKEAKGFVKRALSGRAKTKKLSDGGGLYLTLTPAGTAVWRFKYRILDPSAEGGPKIVERVLAIGVYDEVGLAAARAARDTAKTQLREGRDPVRARLVDRRRAAAASAASFASVVETWLAKQRRDWSEGHYDVVRRAFDRDVLPGLGALPISDINSAMIGAVIEPIAARGAIESAKKIRWHVESVFNFAAAKGLVTSNPAVAVAELLPKRVKRTRRPALLELDALRDILRRTDFAPLSAAVRLALRLCAFGAARAGNVVSAEWSEFDLEAEVPMWTIPRGKMKKRDDRDHDHRVVLGPTITEDLRTWRRMTERGRYVFPSGSTTRAHLTVEALDRAYSKTLKLAGKHSPHGWRAAFKTLALEQGGFSRDATELALDHIHDTDIIRAYDRGERLDERIRMMRWWDEVLSTPARDTSVIPMRRTGA